MQNYDQLRGQVEHVFYNDKAIYLVDDVRVFKRRLNYAADRNLAGVAFWKLENELKAVIFQI